MKAEEVLRGTSYSLFTTNKEFCIKAMEEYASIKQDELIKKIIFKISQEQPQTWYNPADKTWSTNSLPLKDWLKSLKCK
jgi:hypothetical protein